MVTTWPWYVYHTLPMNDLHINRKETKTNINSIQLKLNTFELNWNFIPMSSNHQTFICVPMTTTYSIETLTSFILVIWEHFVLSVHKFLKTDDIFFCSCFKEYLKEFRRISFIFPLIFVVWFLENIWIDFVSLLKVLFWWNMKLFCWFNFPSLSSPVNILST